MNWKSLLESYGLKELIRESYELKKKLVRKLYELIEVIKKSYKIKV